MSKMQSTPIDRLLILVLSGAQSAALTKRLSEEKFYFTLIDSHGGLMEDQTICLLLGVYQQRMPELLELVRRNCKPYRQFIPAQMQLPGELANFPMVEAQLGGALAYALNVSFFEQL
jgi:uncharacterized protein YaaQ